MSNKDRIIQLINDVPDNRLVFIIDMLESLKAYAGEEIEPDEWDLKMIAQAAQENDGNTIVIDELEKIAGYTRDFSRESKFTEMLNMIIDEICRVEEKVNKRFDKIENTLESMQHEINACKMERESVSI